MESPHSLSFFIPSHQPETVSPQDIQTNAVEISDTMRNVYMQ